MDENPRVAIAVGMLFHGLICFIVGWCFGYRRGCKAWTLERATAGIKEFRKGWQRGVLAERERPGQTVPVEETA